MVAVLIALTTTKKGEEGYKVDGEEFSVEVEYVLLQSELVTVGGGSGDGNISSGARSIKEKDWQGIEIEWEK